MPDHGVTKDGFILKRLDEIYDSVCQTFKSETGVDPSENPQGVMNVMFTDLCDEDALLWEALSLAYEQLFPQSAQGIALDRVMEIGGVSRIGKSRTKYTLACTGKEGTYIPAGSLVQSSTYPVKQFQCAKLASITSDNWQTLRIQPISSIAGSITFTFGVDRNATSGKVGTYSSGSSFSKTMTVTSYSDAFAQILSALKAFDALEKLGITVSDETDENGKRAIVLKGANASDSFAATLCSYVTIVNVTSNLLFESVDYGEVPLANGTITQIVTSIDGFESVTNLIPPVTGRLTQTDAEARSSYLDRLANRGRGTVNSITSLLYSDVAGVTYAKGYQNDDDVTDAAGRPPHSIEIIVQGGSDDEVAEIIWRNKAAGIRAYGTHYAYATDSNGDSQYVEFSRVEDIYLLLSVKVTSTGDLADDYVTRIQNLLAEEKLTAGQSIRLQSFIKTIMLNVSGADYIEIRGILSETPDIAGVADSAMLEKVVPVKITQQPVVSANGIRVVKV